jgi:hypothetical protein
VPCRNSKAWREEGITTSRRPALGQAGPVPCRTATEVGEQRISRSRCKPNALGYSSCSLRPPCQTNFGGGSSSSSSNPEAIWESLEALRTQKQFGNQSLELDEIGRHSSFQIACACMPRWIGHLVSLTNEYYQQDERCKGPGAAGA